MIYFDNASTTKPSQVAIDAVNEVLTKHWGNPSSTHSLGVDASEILEWSRKVIADSIGAEPDEIIFTSGASESNNLAIKGYQNGCDYPVDIYSTFIEHPSIYKNVERYLLPEDLLVGYIGDIIWCPEDKWFGGKLLVSIGMANNEIGTIQDIELLSYKTHNAKGILHVDATQAYGHIPINVKELGIDMMSVSGHKLNAPKGIGFLYVRKGIKLDPQIVGGHQEHGLRAGTENVAFAYALAKVVEKEYSPKQIQCDRIYVEELTNYLYNSILKRCSNLCKITLNGVQNLNLANDKRLAGNLSLTFEGVPNESLVTLLDMKGFAISSGSACTSGSLEPSRVLKAIGLSDEEANSTVRISLSKDNNFKEADAFVNALEECLMELLNK